jgi:hypothetical protein
MFNLNFFKQKSPQQRFLFILGVFMITIFLSLGIALIFFSEQLSIDSERFPTPYRIAFAVLLFIYSAIRFGRLISKKNDN